MADNYFHLEWEKESFFQQLRALSQASSSLKSQVWNFESIQRVLFHLAQNSSGEVFSTQLQKVTFTSLRHGNIRTARILWCLGMDEAIFPRPDSYRSLCEMSRLKTKDYYPSQTDEDRILFLNLFIKARDYLIFSYQRINPEDGKPQGSSMLIQELNQYLKSGVAHCDHPSFPFERIYFSKEAKIKKWSEMDYLAAKAYYLEAPLRKQKFNSEAWHVPSDLDQEIVIDIRQLKKLARHPLQFYFNETLKIYLKEEEDEEEKKFLISSLRKSVLRKKALKTSFPQVMRQLRAEGKFPRGLFQDAARQDLEEEFDEFSHHLNAWGVRPEEIASFHFCLHCRDHEKNETIFPPLLIPLSHSKKAYVVGKLDGITPKGLLFHGDKDLKHLIKVWPLYLIHLHLNPQQAKILLTKNGKELELLVPDVQTALASYLEYFLIARTSPSPLMPEWATALLQKTEADFSKAISKSLSDEDPYLNYLQRRHALFDAKEAFDSWSGFLRKVFAPLFGDNNDF